MENLFVKSKKVREAETRKSGKAKKMISDEDIRRRAFEIYKENGVAIHDELEDWLRAERELKRSDK
jgi:Protein of unknown function (DUF2934)